jgi:hypothetical protein
MNAKNVFQLQLRQAWLLQLSAGHTGLTDLSGARYQAERPAHRI